MCCVCFFSAGVLLVLFLCVCVCLLMCCCGCQCFRLWLLLLLLVMPLFGVAACVYLLVCVFCFVVFCAVGLLLLFLVRVCRCCAAVDVSVRLGVVSCMPAVVMLVLCCWCCVVFFFAAVGLACLLRFVFWVSLFLVGAVLVIGLFSGVGVFVLLLL